MVKLNTACAINSSDELVSKSYINNDISTAREQLVMNFISKKNWNSKSREYYEKELTSNIKDMIIAIKKWNPREASRCLSLINRYSNILWIRTKFYIDKKLLEFEENLFPLLAILRENATSNSKIKKIDWQKLVSEFLLLGFPVYVVKEK